MRPALITDNSAVLVVPNVIVRLEAQNSILPLSLHDLLRERFTPSPLISTILNWPTYLFLLVCTNQGAAHAIFSIALLRPPFLQAQSIANDRSLLALCTMSCS
jgi:hypothetical protein